MVAIEWHQFRRPRVEWLQTMLRTRISMSQYFWYQISQQEAKLSLG